MQESSFIQINARRKRETSPLNKTFFKTNGLFIYLFIDFYVRTPWFNKIIKEFKKNFFCFKWFKKSWLLFLMKWSHHWIILPQ